ncbi:MAG: hypothetical protein WCW67_01505 [Candidatus Margulisiibacteriota bacterium]
MDIQAICSSYHVQRLDQQKAAQAEKEVLYLSDMRGIVGMIDRIEQMNQTVNSINFSSEVGMLFLEKARAATDADPFEKRINTIRETIAALKKMPQTKQEKLKEDAANLEKLLETMVSTREIYTKLRDKLSPESQNLELVLSRDTERLRSPNMTRLVDSLRELAQRLNARLQRKIEGEITIGLVNARLSETCQGLKMIDQPAQTIPKTPLPSVDGSRPKARRTEPAPAFDYRLIGGLGYVSGDNGGALGLAGGSARYKLSSTTALQADYRGQLVTTSNTKEGSDDARGTFQLNGERLKLFVQAGYYNFYNGAPDRNIESRNPSRIGLTNAGRLVYNVSDKLAVTFTESVFYGSLDGNSQVRAVVEPGAALKFGPIRPFFGGIVGYDKLSEATMFGGYAGLGFQSGNHDGAARFDYTKVASLLQARYFLGTTFGVGPALFIQNDSETVRTGGSLVGRIKLGNFYLYPSVGGEQVKNGDGK